MRNILFFAHDSALAAHVLETACDFTGARAGRIDSLSLQDPTYGRRLLVSDVFIAQGPRLAARKVGGEMVILSADDSSLYVLNGVGTAVWEAADGRTPLQAIVDGVICREFDVDRETPRVTSTVRQRSRRPRHPRHLAWSRSTDDRGWRRQRHGGVADGRPHAGGAGIGLWTSGVPLSVHFDLTYRCNERCVHCYLDHDDHGEMTTGEVRSVLDQLAAAGTLFLIFSGGELLLRKDFFEFLALYARSLGFDVKLKTNGSAESGAGRSAHP